MAKKIKVCTSLYTPKVMKAFKKPHNYGRIKNPDGVGEIGNPVCGDVMKIYIKVAKNKKSKKIIKDIKFETFGCVAAIATSSLSCIFLKSNVGASRFMSKNSGKSADFF